MCKCSHFSLSFQDGYNVGVTSPSDEDRQTFAAFGIAVVVLGKKWSRDVYFLRYWTFHSSLYTYLAILLSVHPIHFFFLWNHNVGDDNDSFI